MAKTITLLLSYRLVVIFLETAELNVKERKDLTMSFWKENVD